MTQIKHTQICSLTPGQYQPYRNKHTQICTFLLGMTVSFGRCLTYSNGAVRIGGVWSSLNFCLFVLFCSGAGEREEASRWLGDRFVLKISEEGMVGGGKGAGRGGSVGRGGS